MRTLLYSYNDVHSFLVNRCSCIRKLKTSALNSGYVLPSCRKMSCHFVKIYNLSLSLCTYAKVDLSFPRRNFYKSFQGQLLRQKASEKN